MTLTHKAQTDPEAARKALRELLTYVGRYDPELIAKLVPPTAVESTLKSVSAIQTWFAIYAGSLKRTRPQ